MKIKHIGLALGLATLGSVLASTNAQALTFTDWNFSTLPTTPSGTSNNNPAATTGTGTASVLGMTNSYNNTTSVAFADILSDPGSSNGGTNAWRVRGQNPGNGWSTSAPEYTQVLNLILAPLATAISY